jgi:hypothetical protein
VTHFRRWLAAGLCHLVLAATAYAVNPATWNVALSTTGQDVFWTSPTALTLGFPEYDWSYEITKLSAQVFLIGEQDLLGELQSTSGSGTTTTLPAVIVDQSLSEPTTGSTADIRIEIDANGYGQASGTNIELGSYLFFNIQRVDLAATISVIGIPTGDYNRNGAVDLNDYQVWKANFGSTANLAADGNDDDRVDAADYVVWRDAFSSAGGGSIALSVPEPMTAAVILAAAPALALLRRRAPRV